MSKGLEIINNYTSALKELYEHVGFKEDYVFYPIDDQTDKIWEVDEENKIVKFADSVAQFHSDGDHYEDVMYTQRFYQKWVYAGKELTLVFGDSGVDGMKYFRIFLNSNHIKEQS